MTSKVAVVCLLTCAALCGQEFRATLAGRITDPSGAGVAGASVQVQSVATGATSDTLSANDGSYQVPLLNPGQYTLTIQKPGFRKVVREGVVLHVNETGVVNVALELGEVTQSVNVTADTSLVEPETADRGLTIESNRIENTPLQGRNIFANAWSSPGIAVAASVTRLRPFDILGSSSMAINGGQPFGNEVLIDGTSNLAGARQVAYVPPVEGTQEFKVQTTSYDAEYGWTTGGVVNIVTKSGTNRFHGSAYEFLQNTHLNANTFTNNKNGIPRQSSHINTFGGDLGGPIKKDKLFFLFAYENIRQVIPDPFVTSVPTALQRQGDFSQTDFAAGALQTIYDPFTTHAQADGTLVRDPFPNNRIPAGRIDPVAVKVLSLIPAGNIGGNPITGLNNLVSNGATRKFTDFFPEYDGRVDYNINDKTRMFVRYSRNALAEERGFHYSTSSQVNIAETSGNTPFRRENHSATVQVTRVLDPTAVLDFRAGLARFLGVSGSSIGSNYSLANLDFASQYLGQAKPYFPKFNWIGYEGAGSNPVDASPNQTNSFQISLSKVRGRHSLKTGVEFRLQRVYDTNPGYFAGQFTFDQGFTGANPLQIQPSSGNSIASFLLGTATNAGPGSFISVNSAPALQQRLWSGYIQDDINVTPKLKLNAGLRWDYLGPLTDRFNALTRGFDFTSASPLQAPGLNLKGGLLFAGVSGQNRGIYNRDWDAFGPRFGFAYQFDQHTVLRGGYGLIYAQTYDNPGVAPGFSQNTAMVTSIQTGVPYNLLTNPFPAGILQPVHASLGLATDLGQSFNFADPARDIPRTHQFSVEIQRELPGQFLVTAAYVGSRTRGLEVAQPINEVSLADLQKGAAYLSANVPNPMAGLIPGTFLNGPTAQQYQLLRPFPQFGPINELFRSVGQSSYNGFQMMLYKRLSKGLNFSLSYTNSKTISATSFANAQDAHPIRQIDQYDIPQNLQINGVYELPFGPGKPLGAGLNPVIARVIGGWQISGIARIQEGMPMLFPSGAAPTGVSPALPNRSLDHWFNTCTQLPSGGMRGCDAGQQPVWTIQQPFTLREWPFYLASVRRPGVRNLDASVIKNNRIGERLNLGFRVDFLNATNSVQFFDGPETNVNSPNFGRIVESQTNLPRFIQISMRLDF